MTTRTCRLPVRAAVWLHLAIVVLILPAPLDAHHEAIFGPQSTTLVSHRRFVSTQYYFINEGRAPAARQHSHVPVLTVSTALGDRWSVSASLPVEAERGGHERVTGVHDPVIGFRYFPEAGPNRVFITALTIEPPASNLEHRALGTGAGVVYGAERGHWSGIVYGLGRTEFSFDEGEKRGNRLFLGGGLAYETEPLPFSPQIGLSWERVARRREHDAIEEESNTSVLMIHPTLVKTFRQERLQAFLVLSLPAGQWSGHEGWQRFRVAAGLLWTF